MRKLYLGHNSTSLYHEGPSTLLGYEYYYFLYIISIKINTQNFCCIFKNLHVISASLFPNRLVRDRI